MTWKLLVSLAGFAATLSLQGQAADIKRPEPAAAFGESQYRLGPEDVVEVFVWKEQDLSSAVVVRPDGRISLPLTGELDAKGKTAAELQLEIGDRLRKYIADPVVNVIVKEVNNPKVSILGSVHRPDVYKIKQRVTVLDAIAMAGGFTEFAKRDKVYVLRNASTGQQKIRLNLKNLAADGHSDTFYLQPFDTVYVE